MIVGLGEILWDILPSKALLGGAPANFAFQCQKLGSSASIISAVGDDELGKRTLESLRPFELHRQLQVNNKRTATVRVQFLENGDASYAFDEDTAFDYLEESEDLFNLVRGAEVLCFGTLAQRKSKTRDLIQKLLSIAVDENPSSLRVFDVNLRKNYYDREILALSMRKANVLKVNEHELQVLKGFFHLSPENSLALRQLLEQFSLDFALLTLGEAGSFGLSRDEEWHAKSARVQLIDSIGAGDAFIAAFVCEMLKSSSLKRALQFANDHAALICTQAGGMGI